jgi:hypothetical protein
MAQGVDKIYENKMHIGYDKLRCVYVDTVRYFPCRGQSRVYKSAETGQ